MAKNDKKQDERQQDRRQEEKKDDQKSKGNPDNTQTKQVRQGRWRTVETSKVPVTDLQQPQEDNVEHRPLGL